MDSVHVVLRLLRPPVTSQFSLYWSIVKLHKSVALKRKCTLHYTKCPHLIGQVYTLRETYYRGKKKTTKKQQQKTKKTSTTITSLYGLIKCVTTDTSFRRPPQLTSDLINHVSQTSRVLAARIDCGAIIEVVSRPSEIIRWATNGSIVS